MEAYEQLEQEFAEWTGWPNMVVCNSGTAALHLALEAMRLPAGSKVLVPDLTMVACARAVTLAGLRPEFVDCEDDLLISTAILAFPPPDVSAVMPVHVYGRRCEMDLIHRQAKTNGWRVIEDLAEAHGVQPHPETDAACWSFYRNKIVAGEEGGAVAFRNPEHAALARQLRTLGFTDAHDFIHAPRGHNYRLANLLAEPIRRSLKQYAWNAAERRDIEAAYTRLMPDEWLMPGRDAVWVYDVRLRGIGAERQDHIVQGLNAQGIAARHCFRPMSEQPEYGGRIDDTMAHRLSREIVYLPVQPGMTHEAIRRNADALARLATA